MVTVACIGDTHTMHEKVNVPECDILIHAGDFSNLGERSTVQSLIRWFGELKATGRVKEIVCIAGNHELSFCPKKTFHYDEDTKKLLQDATECHYLEQSSVELFGLKIAGYPHQPEYKGWGFNVPRGEEIAQLWETIPDDTDVLVTHGPAYGIGDFIPMSAFDTFENPHDADPILDAYRLVYLGCEDLTARVKQLSNLKLHVCGHIHFGNGIYELSGERISGTSIDKTIVDGIEGPIFANGAICSEQYTATQSPIVVEL